MQEAGRLSLGEKTGILVGSGFAPSPKDPTGSVNVAVYKTDDQWVICLAEVGSCGEMESADQLAALGTEFPGRLFAAYAARGIGGQTSYASVREMIDRSVPKSFPGMTIRWLEDIKLDAIVEANRKEIS